MECGAAIVVPEIVQTIEKAADGVKRPIGKDSHVADVALEKARRGKAAAACGDHGRGVVDAGVTIGDCREWKNRPAGADAEVE